MMSGLVFQKYSFSLILNFNIINCLYIGNKNINLNILIFHFTPKIHFNHIFSDVSIQNYFFSINLYSQNNNPMRRCITPTPHSKPKYLSELVDIAGHESVQSTYINDKKASTHKINDNEGKKINYDSFIYVDRLTNNKIVLRQAKSMYAINKETHSHYGSNVNNHYSNHNLCLNSMGLGMRRPTSHVQNRQKQYSKSKEMQQINDCFSIMKSTKLFQMENLKNKLFNKGQQQMGMAQSENSNKNKQSEQISEMIKKKKKIRQYIEQYLTSLCLNQFRKYMSPEKQKQKNRGRLINPNILSIYRGMSNKISKQNIQRIIQQFLLSQNIEEDKKNQVKISIDDIQFPDQNRLKQLLIHRMFIKNKQFQYLVTPTNKRQIYNRIYAQKTNNCQPVKKQAVNDNINNDMSFFQQNNPKTAPISQINLSDYHFNQFSQKDIQKIVQPLKKKSKRTFKQQNLNRQIEKKIELKQKQLLLSIDAGSLYDVLFLIIRWPSLLHYKDSKGNNLLHISAKSNQPQIYNILVKKLGVDSIKQKNNTAWEKFHRVGRTIWVLLSSKNQ